MAVAPSSNLLSALSQLQAPRPASAPQRTQPASSGASTGASTGTGATTATQPNSFAAQLGSIGSSIQVADQRPATPAPVQSQQQSRPIPTRGGYLGQHVNILV